ncbi:MAG: tRNA epoxyqueuosine(34) reductase QueG [Acidimicrobiia bacterium]|nr:tRNA epoxyqueuosine(34) reductase QueG [Acidimicrobiia bacterium]MCY4433185.1 tRNA epoxyqueuosine(34) reductase QueG [bacterium]
MINLGSEAVIAAGLAAGLDAVGVASAEPFESTRATLLERRDEGLHGGMAFTYRNPDRSTDPGRALSGARSLVVGALGYQRPPVPAPDRPVGRVAAYARSDHYAKLRDALGQVAEMLRSAGHRASVVADDNALVDREAAQRAGLGWYGKNSNILLPGQGSWFVLGSVITTAELDPSTPVPDQCGPCRRCLDGCPTGAIVAPGVVDARRCLAWLVQDGGDFPLEFREALGDRIYGCDDCQEVCPPNRRVPSAEDTDGDAKAELEEDTAWVDLVELLDLDDEELMDRHGRWYIPRREPRYVRRNALVALGNTGRGADPDVAEMVERYLSDPDPMLVRHASWAAHRLGVSVAEPV